MQPELIHASERFACGIGVRNSNAAESTPQTSEVFPLWRRFFNEKRGENIGARQSPNLLFGIYSNYESDHDGAYDLHVAGKVNSHTQDFQEFDILRIPAGRYLVFRNRGTMPQAVLQTWDHIQRFFESNADNQRAFTTDFEVYDLRDDGGVEIHIAICDPDELMPNYPPR